uniref:Uncharacterized protein n=1 Tax=Arundo donax TaxID=35708 RepID=A0A0A9EV25_ARUDO
MTTRCSGKPTPCATSSSASELHTSSPPPRAGSFSTSCCFPFASFTAAAAAGDGAGRKQPIHLPLPLLSAAGVVAPSPSRRLATARGHREDRAPGAGVAARPIEAAPAAIIRRPGGGRGPRRRPRCGGAEWSNPTGGGYFAGKVR